MYTKVENAGFKKELTETFIEKYQGNYALTEDSTDYLVTPKSIGKYELDIDNFLLTARKGDRDITIMIDENRKIFLSLYPGQVEIDENGNSNVCDQSGGFPLHFFFPITAGDPASQNSSFQSRDKLPRWQTAPLQKYILSLLPRSASPAETWKTVSDI